MVHKYDTGTSGTDGGKTQNMNQETKVAVVGGSGYAGLELVRLLQRHPSANLRVCFSTNPSLSFSDYLPDRGARGITVAPLAELSKWVHELDTVFLATPIEVSVELAPVLLKEGINVIDLSGAFRLTQGTKDERLSAYDSFYQFAHPCPELLDQAEYGLLPWKKSRELPLSAPKTPALIANPGCYATSVLMALLPLLKRNLIQTEGLVIDAKSGTSGAGRKARENLLFTEVEGECLPYRIGTHQHLPEIRQYTKSFVSAEIDPAFATHLLPIRRGIITSMYAKLSPGVTAKDIDVAYCSDYSDYGLVEWGELQGGSSTGSGRADSYSLSLKRVVGTGMTRVQYQLESGHLYLFSLIDNLIKGAAGQAIENFNAIQKIPLGTGLKHLEGVL